jgi:hypothetical protein
MRISEIAPGQTKPMALRPDEDKFNTAWERLIVPNCSDIIGVYRNAEEFLFRGMKDKPDFFREMSRNDRKPKDSSKDISTMFDKMLAANGMTALRGNSIFAISDRGHTTDFGDPYIIFPVNGFDFTYTNEKDILLDSWTHLIPPKTSTYLTKLMSDHQIAQGAGEMSYYHNWITLDNLHTRQSLSALEFAIERMRELFPDNELAGDLTIDKLINPEGFAERYDPSNTDLADAIKTQREVYIHGQYYAFRYSTYNLLIRVKMGIY